MRDPKEYDQSEVRTSIPYDPERDKRQQDNKIKRRAAWKDRMKALRNTTK